MKRNIKWFACVLTITLMAISGTSSADDKSVKDIAGEMRDLDFTNVPQWTDQEIEDFFVYSRDLNYIEELGPSPYLRRITWLLPDHACTARAEQVNYLATTHFLLETPYKLWAFGDKLTVYTNNAYGEGDLSNRVIWDNHVVPLVRNSAGEPVVLDPAINPCKPLNWQDWLAAMVPDVTLFNDDPANPDDDAFKVAISDSCAFMTWDDAFNDPACDAHPDMGLMDLQKFFLKFEYERQVDDLGRDVNDYFYNDPPIWTTGVQFEAEEAKATDDPDRVHVFYEHEDNEGGIIEVLPKGWGWGLWKNGNIYFEHTFTGGVQKMSIRALGTSAGGVDPIMNVDIVNATGTRTVYSTAVATDYWYWYEFTFNAPTGGSKVEIHFTNEGGTPPNDRTLLLDAIALECPEEPAAIDLGPIHDETFFSVNDNEDLVIEQFDFTGWPPAKIVVGLSPTDGQPMDGMSVSVEGAPPVDLAGWWHPIEIPYIGQNDIDMRIISSSPRNLKTQWWGSN